MKTKNLDNIIESWTEKKILPQLTNSILHYVLNNNPKKMTIELEKENGNLYCAKFIVLKEYTTQNKPQTKTDTFK